MKSKSWLTFSGKYNTQQYKTAIRFANIFWIFLFFLNDFSICSAKLNFDGKFKCVFKNVIYCHLSASSLVTIIS